VERLYSNIASLACNFHFLGHRAPMEINLAWRSRAKFDPHRCSVFIPAGQKTPKSYD